MIHLIIFQNMKVSFSVHVYVCMCMHSLCKCSRNQKALEEHAWCKTPAWLLRHLVPYILNTKLLNKVAIAHLIYVLNQCPLFLRVHFIYHVQTVLNVYEWLDLSVFIEHLIYLLHFEAVVVQCPAGHSKLPSEKQFHWQQQKGDVRHFHLCSHSLLCLHSATTALL